MSTIYPDSLEADGCWCPMAHGNRTDDSFQQLPPIRSAHSLQKLTAPVASSSGFIHLGSFTGRDNAVCTYSSPHLPALAAYDYADGSLLWTSDVEDLPGRPLRVPTGILMARMGVGGRSPEACVFVANGTEFVAFHRDGGRLWKRRSDEIVPGLNKSIGLPISLSFNDSKELVAATNEGWLVKLSPVDGETIDSYRMAAKVSLNGRVYEGIFYTAKSPIVIKDVLYLLVEFRADEKNLLPSLYSPVHVVRIELTQPQVRSSEHKIKPLIPLRHAGEELPDRIFVGLNRGRGSPPAGFYPDGVLLFAHGHCVRNGRFYPTITAVEDDRGVLKKRWSSALNVRRGDSVYSAPALHRPSGNLFVTTVQHIFHFRDVNQLTGHVPSPIPLASDEMIAVACDHRVAKVGVGSPFALAYDPECDEIVVYTNFRAITHMGRSYGLIGAFAVPAHRRAKPRPLWHRPLAVTASGTVAPGLGTLGQPALFRCDTDKGQSTGLIVNTVRTGTYIIR